MSVENPNLFQDQKDQSAHPTRFDLGFFPNKTLYNFDPEVRIIYQSKQTPDQFVVKAHRNK